MTLATDRLLGALLCACVFLAGCGSDSGDKQTREPTPEPEVKEPPAPVYEAPEPGYLRGADFSFSEQGQLEHWSLAQHSSDLSYAITSDDGVLSVTRTGDEPWGKVRQIFKNTAIEPLLGQRLRFSADIRADFTSEWGEAMEPPGLVAVAKGVPAGSPAILGKSVLVSEKAPVDDIDSTADWQRYEVTFTVPAPEQASATELEVSFLMTEGGTLYIRGPSLVHLPESAAE